MGYGKKDAARDTRSSTKEVSRAHHQARQDAKVHAGGDKKQIESPVNNNMSKNLPSGQPLLPKRHR